MEHGMGACSKDNVSKKTAANVFCHVVNIATAAVLIVFVWMQAILLLGYEPYRILTGSMEPTLTTGEIVLIDTNNRDADIGEIIAFYIGDHVVIHRVMDVKLNGEYQTKGDANQTEDFGSVEQTEMVGVLWMRLGSLTWIWDLFSSIKKYLLVLVLVVLNGSKEHLSVQTGGDEIGYGAV